MSRYETQAIGRGLRAVLVSGVLLGVVVTLGCGCWVAFALMFAPFDLVGGWWVRVFAFLFSGPLTLMPGCALALRRRLAGGRLLVAAALTSAVTGVWLMTPTPAEVWSPYPGDPVGYYKYVAYWSMYLLVPVSLPLGLLGVWTLLALRPRGAWWAGDRRDRWAGTQAE